jgi:hypothetical protein
VYYYCGPAAAEPRRTPPSLMVSESCVRVFYKPRRSGPGHRTNRGDPVAAAADHQRSAGVTVTGYRLVPRTVGDRTVTVTGGRRG